jgi:hypothetical protein
MLWPQMLRLARLMRSWAPWWRAKLILVPMPPLQRSPLSRLERLSLTAWLPPRKAMPLAVLLSGVALAWKGLLGRSPASFREPSRPPRMRNRIAAADGVRRWLPSTWALRVAARRDPGGRAPALGRRRMRAPCELEWWATSVGATGVWATCVGATGATATGGGAAVDLGATWIGAGGASRSMAGAEASSGASRASNGSKGSAARSSNGESVKPGLVATRATKAASALELPVVVVAAEAVEAPDAVAAPDDVEANGSGRGSDSALAADADVGADFAQRPDVDAAPAVGEAVDEFGTLARAAAPGVCAVVCAEDAAKPLGAPDVGVGVGAGAGELLGLAGRGGAFAAGGGEAAGAGRAGGTVGIADLGVIFGAGAEDDAADDAAELAAAEVAEAVDADEAPDDVPNVVVGRLASLGAADAGRAASAARAVGMFVIAELAARVGAAPVDAEAGAEVDAGAEAEVVVPRVGLDAGGVGAAPVLAEGAGVREAAPACVGCEGVGLEAADLLEVCVGSVAVPVADLRAVAAAADGDDDTASEDCFAETADPAEAADAPDPAGAADVLDATDPLSAVGPAASDPEDVAAVIAAPEVAVAGGADRVGGIGASTDPRSAASNIGDAQVPEYALSANVDPPCELAAELPAPPDGVTSPAGVTVVLGAFAAELDESLAVEAGVLVPLVAASVEDEPDALVERAAASVDERPEAFPAVGFDPCPGAAAGAAGMPKPAGILIASGAADDFAADAL